MRSFVISRLRAALAIVAFTAAAGAHAQLALNGTSTASVTVTNTTLAQTVAHTTPALANRVMLVAVHMNVNNSPGATVASVTYAGQPLFLVAALTEAGNDVRTELWAIIGPATGANNVVVTAAGVTAGAPNDAVIGVTTWIDVNTTAGALYTAEGSSNTPTSTLAGTAAGDIVADFMSARQNAGGTVTATVGAGQTSIYNALSPNVQNVDDVRAAASYETSTGANVTTSYTLASVQEWVKAGVNMKPAITDVDIKGQATPDLVDGSPTQVSFVYTITANGLGANNVNFSTTLPAGLTLVSATSTQGACAAGPPTTCAIGSLMNAGDSATVTVVATTAAGGIATIYNVVGSVTVGTSDSVAGNNSATVTVRTQSKLCANPGKDGAGGTITGSVNTYYPATANAASGTASITLGAVPAGYGATNIAIGDLLLVMQMQDATIDSSNNDRYGDGTGNGGTATAGSGSSNLNNAGRYEYVVATNAITTAGGGLTFKGAGNNNGLIYAYTNAAAAGAQGARRYQVIRVPQYTTATFAAGAGGPAWNGTVGGVFAADISGTVTMGSGAATGTLATTNGSKQVTGTGTSFTTQVRNGDRITITGQGTFTVLLITSNTNMYLTSPATATVASATFTVPQISMSGRGFRGAAGRQLAGGAGANTDYVTTAATAANAQKGEGIAGTPRYLFASTGAPVDTGVDGYPNGSSARGAPGNAGGGGTDGETVSNQMNTGGGGGANGGDGGGGGNAWNNANASGGFGGTFEAPGTTRLIMGGGGGAGTTNNGTSDTGPGGENSPSLGTNGINSSGVAGGGIIMIRANQINGTGTILTNGAFALKVANDAGGGGGAGGTVLIDTQYGTLTGLTVEARGGSGGDAWIRQASPCSVGPCPPNPRDFPGERHGPGGGGGGGVIYLSSAAGTTNVTGGANGLTTTDLDNFGATPGLPGIVSSPLSVVAGADGGYSCAVVDLVVTNVDTPDPVTTGSNITYTQTLTNNGPNFADQVTFSTSIPASAVYQSMVVPAGWTCITPPIGGSGTITCTNAGLASGASANFSVVVQTNFGTPAGYLVSDTDNATSLTNDSNYANNTATTTTPVVNASVADVSVVITAPATVVANVNYNVTQTVRNGGGLAAANPSFSENTPPNTTFQGITPPAGWTCITPPIGGTGAITCSSATPLGVGASVSFPLILKVNAGTPNNTLVTETANAASTTPDPNTSNNTSSATTRVVAANSADLGVTMTSSPAQVGPSDLVRFTSTVTNNGVVATNATIAGVTHTVPANTTFVSMTVPAGWTCTLPAVGAAAGTQIPCSTTATMAVGASATFVETYQAVVGTLNNTTLTQSMTVAVAAPPAGVTDSNATNNTASASSVVRATGNADLAITKTDSPDPVGQGQLVTYLLTVVNNGPEIATGVQTSDPLPASMVFQSSSASQGFCAGTTTVTCTLGTIPVNGSATISIVVQATATGTINNTATVTGTKTDPVAANNSSTANTTVLAVTLIKLRDFTATQDGKSVTLVWQTSYEQDNLGFNLYRESNGARVKINKSLIAGSALTSKKQDSKSGYIYRYHDKLDSANTFAQYTLEDVDLHGVKTMWGPYLPVFGKQTDGGDSAPLPGLGQGGPVVASGAGFGVVRDLTIGTPTAAQTKLQYDLAGEPTLKIYVAEEGWYRITRAQMVAAGFDPGSDTKDLSLYVAGIEQPLIVDTGDDKKFDTTDAIEFYGINLDTASTGARTYWLRSKNGSGGDRIKQQKDKGTDLTASGTSFTYQRAERGIFFSAAITNGDAQNFFGPVITSDPTNQDLPVSNLDPSFSGNASVELTIQGGTDGTHVILATINGRDLGTATLTKQNQLVQSFAFPQSYLVNGTNTLTLRSLSGIEDASALALTRLTYQHLFRADNGALEVTVPGGRSVNAGGFTSDKVRALDITDAQHPAELQVVTSVEAGGTYVASFTPSSGNARVVFVAQQSRIITTPEMSFNRPSTYNSVSGKSGADLLIISHSSFMSAAAKLQPVREAEGTSTMLIDVEDLYDEFNFGIRDPQAIKTFLQYAKSYKTDPKYALLVGDATIDPRNYLGTGSLDFVPTKMVTTSLMKTASDDWLADFDGDFVSDIPLGRIPVDTAADATIVFNKLVTRGKPSGAWTTDALFVADATGDFDFANAANELKPLLPSGWTNSTIEIANTPNSRSAIVNAMNQGQMIVDYIGHGSQEIWSNLDGFSSTDARALTNGNRLPFVVAMTCLNGYFVDVYTGSLAETLLNAPNGGAIAVWASSMLTQPDAQAMMNAELFRQLFGTAKTIGEAAMKAKRVTSDTDVKKSWILFGDPSMKLK